MALLKNIQWADDSKNTIIHKFDMKRDYISRGSALTVRDGQSVVFAHKGQMGDVFLPGFYKLDTDSIPFITAIMSWKYGFENPFRSDVYYVNTTQFTNQKWGTSNPIIVRDKDFGAIRIRAFGTYSFRVLDAFVFLRELTGTRSSFKTEDIGDYLRSIVIMGVTDAIGESKIPILDMAANLMELSKIVRTTIESTFKKIGIEVPQFNIENFSMPEQLEKALDDSASLGMLRNNMDVYTQKAQADALKEAAKNPGMAGTALGAGLGFGMGQNLGGAYGKNQPSPVAKSPEKCVDCGEPLLTNSKFCAKCGKPTGIICPDCKKVSPADAQFCHECGKTFDSKCKKCDTEVPVGAKFCQHCGEKM